MKAAYYQHYGTPENISIREVDKPVPKAHQVLIRVRAACINSWDWDLLEGTYFFTRLLGGFFSPRYHVLGCDVAGTVEFVGSKVTDLKVGDEVFGDLSGDNFGCFAEYVCGSAKVLAKKPEGLSFENACTIPQAGLLALQGLRAGPELKSGSRVLINGGGGGVGVFAIQLAKMKGAIVTGVDTSAKFELMRSLGADYVVDFHTENFTQSGKHYDLILDNKATFSMFDYWKALSGTGTYAMLGGATSRIFQMLFLGKLLSTRGRSLRMVALKYSREDLNYMAGLVTNGQLKTVIDRTFPLSETAEAFRYFGRGEFKGKVMIEMDT